MKLLTLTLAAAIVMAATGCETSPLKKYGSVEAYAASTALDPSKPHFGDGTPLRDPVMEAAAKAKLPPGMIVQMAPYIPPQPAAPPQPVIVTGPGSAPVTTVSTPGQPTTTVINWGQPIYNRPYNPYLWNY